MNKPDSSRPTYALWAPEMATPGGVQSYMWRLWEVLTGIDSATGTTPPAGLSLLDSTAQLAAWPNPTQPRPVGANGSRANFVRLALGNSRAQCVIVGHLNQAPVALLAKLLGRVDRYIVVLHGIEAWHRQTFWRRLAMRYAHTVVATTNYTLQTCAEVNSLPTSNFKVIPLCAEPNPAKPDPNFKLDGTFPILFVGRLAKSEQYKGLETLMQAVASLIGKHIPAKLHVVGDGDDRTRLQYVGQAMGLGIDHIYFHGRVSDSELQAAYASAQVFAMPSAKEGFGIVFLEAMRHGIACIGGAHGGTPEVFTHSREGYLIDYDDVVILTQHLETLFTNLNLRLRFSKAGRHRFESDYIFQAFNKKWSVLITEKK